MNIHHFRKMKEQGEKISMITCYDYALAKIVNETEIDCLLVGDSLAMVMHGHPTTIPATMELMIAHTQAVAKGAPKKFIISDLPFLSYRKGLKEAMDAVQGLMHAGAQAVKLEGVTGNEEFIAHLVASGVPVMGHIGLTPQLFHQLGGFRVQGKEEAAAKILLNEAKTLEKLGCFSVVLECIPSELAKNITDKISIPTIGIGAGQYTSGQVLVLHDMLGMGGGFKPKFVKKFLDGFELIKNSINQYHQEVREEKFPSDGHCY